MRGFSTWKLGDEASIPKDRSSGLGSRSARYASKLETVTSRVKTLAKFSDVSRFEVSGTDLNLRGGAA
jgi:hypothetical protein